MRNTKQVFGAFVLYAAVVLAIGIGGRYWIEQPASASYVQSPGNIAYQPFQQVVDANFAWANQQTASQSIVTGIAYLTVPQLTGDNLCAREAAAPGSTPWSITIAIEATMTSANSNTGVGLEVRDSVGGHLEAVQLETAATGFSATPKLQQLNGTLTSWSHTASTNIQAAIGGIYFLKVLNDGVNLNFSGSADGVNFSLNAQRALAGFGNTPNKVGYFTQSENAAANTSIAVLSWKQGTT